MGPTRRTAGGRGRRPVIALEDRDFIRGAAAWAAKTDVSTLDTGLSREEARRRAAELICALRIGSLKVSEVPLSGEEIDVLYAACELLTERFAGLRPQTTDEAPALYDAVATTPPPETKHERAAVLADSLSVEHPDLLADARRLYDYVSAARWPDPDFCERAEVLADCAFLGWRIARLMAPPPEMNEWQTRFVASEPLSSRRKADHFRADPISSPATLLTLLESLKQRWETSPEEVLEESIHVYRSLEKVGPQRPTDAFLLDEREYFLGETAYIVGAVSRSQSHREEARQWLDLANDWFLLTKNSAGNLLKVNYQRLFLRLEERELSFVEALLPQLIADFEKLGMEEESLKAKFLEAEFFRETDRISEALEAYRQIAHDATALKNERLLAYGYVNLVQINGVLGNAEEAVTNLAKATPLLKKLRNGIGLAKLHLGVGYLLRSTKDFSGACEAFRAAQREFADMSMWADVAAIYLVLADLLLENGQEKQAEREIRQALPIVDEYKLVPEGFAALSLLRESLRRQKIDRTALRDLHNHFDDTKNNR